MSFKHPLWYISPTTNDVWRVACCFYMIVYNNVSGLLFNFILFYATTQHPVMLYKRPCTFKGLWNFLNLLVVQTHIFSLDKNKEILWYLYNNFSYHFINRNMNQILINYIQNQFITKVDIYLVVYLFTLFTIVWWDKTIT